MRDVMVFRILGLMRPDIIFIHPNLIQHMRCLIAIAGLAIVCGCLCCGPSNGIDAPLALTTIQDDTMTGETILRPDGKSTDTGRKNDAGTIDSDSTPSDRNSCERMGGRWGKVGLAPKESCNLPASDAGEQCSDMGECEGACMGDSPGKGEDSVGTCSEWKTVVGCHTFIVDGKGRKICYD
jgi:hypothetical protein